MKLLRWTQRLARRDFLGGLLHLAWVLPLGLFLKGALKYLRYESPTTPVTQFPVGNAASLPELPAYIEAARVWLRQDAGGYTAIDAVYAHIWAVLYGCSPAARNTARPVTAAALPYLAKSCKAPPSARCCFIACIGAVTDSLPWIALRQWMHHSGCRPTDECHRP